ncbi:RRP15-like protein [Harmonia axyridis]|uniref:RRP15-like protein n=1 Tax=Harmonia axyridis TaxID=115357 RepID=UPI001E2789E4|nr:RRP15-like protein [Harmonia axyridis]
MKRVIVEESDDSRSEDENVLSGNEDEVNSGEEENFASDEGETSDDQGSDAENGSKNSAWADSVSKILKSKPKPNKPLVLSKAKKLTDVKAKPKESEFEVVQEDGEIKKELVEDKPVEEKKETKVKRKRTKEIPGLRVKPDILEKDRERILTKVATRGVVQLFNAVRNQQKDINKKLYEAGPLEVRKEKVMKSIDKNTFLDTLMGQKSEQVDEVLAKEEHIPKKIKLDKEDNSGKVWDVLKDNYMMDAKMKDWDKELDSDLELETA